MAIVDIDNKVYGDMDKIVKSNKLKYKSNRNYASVAIQEYNEKNKVIDYATNIGRITRTTNSN
jgi:N-acetylneuraminic acid mutarotase